jgi:uncharacterized protein
MASRFVRDPHEVVAVGDIVKVWVLEIDKGRRRVSLTMIAPGSRRGDPVAGKHPASQSGQQTEQAGEPRGDGRSRRPRRPPRPTPAAAAHDAAPAGAENAPSDPAAIASGGQSAAPRQPPQRPRFQRPGGPRTQHGAAQAKPHYRPKPKPAPLIPITDAMKKGKEPLRTFGDLKQFLEIKPDEPEIDQETGPPSGDELAASEQ